MSSSPRILVTNDDGIFAPGIYALWEAMNKIGDVTVVAPDSEKSAVGHAITLTDPIRVQEMNGKNGFSGFAVKGTPADCVKIAGKALMKDPPDIVVSGINSGANIGNDIIYSGTVSAATEGTILGIPSVAVSLSARIGGHLESAQKAAKTVVKKVIENGLPKGILLNVNVPNIPESELKGTLITRQGNLVFSDKFEKREDPRGKTYYWMGGDHSNKHEEGTDGFAIKEGYISITPIHYRLTEDSFIEKLNNWGF
jgi:5'-nucleotidase